MKGFVQDIDGLTVKNDEFRRVLYTTKNCQLVVMALKPKEGNGAEVRKLDQFFRVEEGAHSLQDDDAQCGRVHATLPVARSAGRLSPHPALRADRQCRAQE